MRNSFRAIVTALLLSQPIIAAEPFEIRTFDGGSNRELQYLLKLPVDSSSDKVFIFIGGDGEGCSPFDPGHFMAMAEPLQLKDAWVVPNTARDALCISKEYQKLDFNHRAIEIENLVNALRSDRTIMDKRFFLVAISGGAKAALLALPRLHRIDGVILINGIGSNLETMLYNQIILNGLKEGKSDSDIETSLSVQKEIFSEIKSDCSKDVVTWTDRSNLFWCQLINGSQQLQPQNWLHNSRYLMIHGEQDPTVPAQVAIDRHSLLLASGHKSTLKIFRGMTHNFYQFMSVAIPYLVQWTEK